MGTGMYQGRIAEISGDMEINPGRTRTPEPQPRSRSGITLNRLHRLDRGMSRETTRTIDEIPRTTIQGEDRTATRPQEADHPPEEDEAPPEVEEAHLAEAEAPQEATDLQTTMTDHLIGMISPNNHNDKQQEVEVEMNPRPTLLKHSTKMTKNVNLHLECEHPRALNANLTSNLQAGYGYPPRTDVRRKSTESIKT